MELGWQSPGFSSQQAGILILKYGGALLIILVFQRWRQKD